MRSNTPPRDARFATARWIALGSAFLLLLGVAFLLDDSIDRWVIATRTPGWETIAKTCSRFFAWHWLMLGAAISFFVAWRRRRRDGMRLLAVMMIAASLAGLSADVLRGMIGRTRPSATVEQGWYGVRSNSQWLIFKHAYNSFPSGHTTAATAFALPLFLWRRPLGVVVFPFIVVVASSRIYVSAHHLSDVIAGAALGAVIALLIWRRLPNDFPWRRARA
ncbi:MAG: phosphatase PAP2 family protein [Chthoniobacterales bacterium]